MAIPSKALSATTLLLLAFNILLSLPKCHADHPKETSSIHHIVRRVGRPLASAKHGRRPPFKPGQWKQAHATFYEGGSGSFGGACGYEDVVKLGYGLNTAAVSSAMFKNGEHCGACYEIKCVDSPQWCKPGQPSLMVTATDHCPGGEWCSPPREHFDLAKPAFLQIAESKGGVVPVRYRRYPCKKQGGIRFMITGNPYFNLVSVSNVGGAGDVIGVEVKGDDKLPWTTLKRNWGQKWQTDCKLVGETLTFRVRTSDGKSSTAWNLVPKNWQFGQTFESRKNFHIKKSP